MQVMEREARVEALVEFRTWHEATRARDALHGRCIYAGCCYLDIQHVQPSEHSIPELPHTDMAMASLDRFGYELAILVEAMKTSSDSSQVDAAASPICSSNTSMPTGCLMPSPYHDTSSVSITTLPSPPEVIPAINAFTTGTNFATSTRCSTYGPMNKSSRAAEAWW